MLLLAHAAGCVIEVHHVDHHLRQTSGADAVHVRELCERLDVAFVLHDVHELAGPNLEARLRDARRVVLPAGALTGHTADDQAETVLLNMMRGAGIDGLSGMRAECHPILSLRRIETEAVCESFGVTPCWDHTNRDPQFRRNRVRQELIPLMRDIARRDVTDVIANQARNLRDDAALLEDLAAPHDPTDAKALAALPLAVARRVIRRWLGGQHPPDARTVDRVLEVARGDALGTEIGGGAQVRRSANRLRIVLSTENISGLKE